MERRRFTCHETAALEWKELIQISRSAERKLQVWISYLWEIICTFVQEYQFKLVWTDWLMYEDDKRVQVNTFKMQLELSPVFFMHFLSKCQFVQWFQWFCYILQLQILLRTFECPTNSPHYYSIPAPGTPHFSVVWCKTVALVQV